MKEQMVNHIKELEQQYKEGRWLSFNHIAEVYLYEFYGKEEKYKLASDPMNRLYLELGKQYEEDESYAMAMKAYQKAIVWNPADLDARFARIELLKVDGDIASVQEETMELYPYLCTRATMAKFYRNLAFCQLETYQPNLAAMLYQYSNLFFHSEHADNEIAFLEKALNNRYPEWDIHELQAALADKQIPVAAPSQTLGLLYQIGKSEESKGHIQEAMDCYMMVYDLTQDEEVRKHLMKLSV